MTSKATQTVALDALAKDLKIQVVYEGRGFVSLKSMSVERPGLLLSGFLNYFDPRRIIVLGLSEYEYLRTFSSEERTERLAKIFELGNPPCIILSRDLSAPEELLAVAKKSGCPVFRSPKITTDLMSDLYIYLNRMLAPTTTEHGVLMEVFGVGMLLTGKNGVGKSETAIELIKRGHRLVADDCVIIKEIANELYGTAPEDIRHFMELRGIGIINVRSMYGSGSVLHEKKVDIVVQLEPRQDGKDYDRIGNKNEYSEYLGVKIPKLTIPVSPSRNLAIIAEVAARNFLLKSLGYDAAEELIQKKFGN